MDDPKKIVVFAPYASVDSSFGIDLELVQGHLNRGDQVTLVTCGADLDRCDRNPHGSKLVCRDCIAKSELGVAALNNTGLLSVRKIGELADRKILSNSVTDLPPVKDITSLKRLSIMDLDVGYAAASSLITLSGSAQPDLKRYSRLLQGLVSSYLLTFFTLTKLFKNSQNDKMYVFNGRYSVTSAAIKAAEASGIDYATHDRGRSHKHYAVFDNANAADMRWFSEKVEERWVDADDRNREKIVDEWFLKKRSGQPLEWVSFTAAQKENLLPESWSMDCQNYVVYTSSENETAALGPEWENRLFDNQASGIRFLASQLAKLDAKSSSKSRLYVRIHPNQTNASKAEVQKFTDIKMDNVEIVLPSSKVSTYALLDASYAVITFGSTMGVEATYWGKPSILLAPTFYMNTDSCYTPQDLDEVTSLIRSKLTPKPRIGAYKYGYLMATLGDTFSYYEPIDFLRGTFNGKTLRSKELASIILRKLRFVALKVRKFRGAITA